MRKVHHEIVRQKSSSRGGTRSGLDGDLAHGSVSPYANAACHVFGCELDQFRYRTRLSTSARLPGACDPDRL
jgi:hypothetical protein